MKAPASSVASTAKPFSWPSFFTAATPASMEVWRKPAVLEKTSTRGCACCANETPAVVSRSSVTTTLRSIVESRAMIGLVDVTGCVRIRDTNKPEPRAPASTPIGALGGELSTDRLPSRVGWLASAYFFAGTGSAVNVPLTENGATSTVPLSFVGDSSLPE